MAWVQKRLVIVGHSGGRNPDEVEKLFRLATEQRLEVADESVYVSLAGGLGDDVLVVVVAEAAGQLFVVHLWLVLALTPASGNLRLE